MVPVSRLVGRITGMQPYLATAPAGPCDPVTSHPRIVVAGGGIAGTSAAVVFAERGIPVVICEAAGHLGAHPRTLYHRFEAGARSWHEHTGGSVVELHAYVCPPGVAVTELGATMPAELGQFWPETRRLHQVDHYCHVGDDGRVPARRACHYPGRVHDPPRAEARRRLGRDTVLLRAHPTRRHHRHRRRQHHPHRLAIPHRAGVVCAAAGHPGQPVGRGDAPGNRTAGPRTVKGAPWMPGSTCWYSGHASR